MRAMPGKRGNVVDFNRRRENNRQSLLERLFVQHGMAVCAFLRARIGSDDSVEDLVQEVFSKVAEMKDVEQRLPPELATTRSFLVTMANNLMVDKERQKQVRKRHLERETPLQGEEDQRICSISPEAQVFAGEKLDFVKEVILKMTPGTREVFLLNRFKGLTQREIAVRKGISVKQVEQYMRQAMLKLQEAAEELKRWEQQP